MIRNIGRYLALFYYKNILNDVNEFLFFQEFYAHVKEEKCNQLFIKTQRLTKKY